MMEAHTTIVAAEELLEAVAAGYVSNDHPDVAEAKRVLGVRANAILAKSRWNDAAHHCVAGSYGSGKRR
ncbi:MAG: hypothetical protein WCO16_02180 [bacterium]